MTQPSFTSISPASGHPGGGQIATIIGANFRAVEKAYTVPESPIATVAVTIGGEAVEEIWVKSDTEIAIRIPTAVFDPTSAIAQAVKLNKNVSRIIFDPVDLVITNLDDEGVPIPGESLTVEDAYTYEQPLVRLPDGDPPILQVLCHFLRLLKRNIVYRVACNTNTDFGEEGITYSVLSEHPSIGVMMDVLDDKEYSHYDNDIRVLAMGDNTYREFAMQTTIMLIFKLTLSSHNFDECMHMINNLIDLPMASPWLVVPPDPNYPISIPNNKYPLELIQKPKQVGSPNNANISAYEAQLRVRGIPILHGDPSTEFIKRRMTMVLTTSDMEGNNPLSVTSP